MSYYEGTTATEAHALKAGQTVRMPGGTTVTLTTVENRPDRTTVVVGDTSDGRDYWRQVAWSARYYVEG